MERELILANPDLKRLLADLVREAGERVESVVLYGSAARGTYRAGTSDLNLILVLSDLDADALERLSRALTRWRRRGQPQPRLFTRQLIAEAADVFPIELSDLAQFRIVLQGNDPFADVHVDAMHLRLQCERELREKLMRLREAYISAHGRPKQILQLLKDSYTTFTAIFRGSLRLLGAAVPAEDAQVAGEFCAVAGLDPAPFAEVAALRRGEGRDANARELFHRYYSELRGAVAAIDRFDPAKGGE